MDRNQLLNDPETSTRTFLDGRQAALWTAMPGMVTKVNLTAMTVEVQLTIQGKVYLQDGTFKYVDISPLQDVPICFPKAGDFVLTLPIAIGDEVLVVIASRCIDAWWQNGGYQNQPMEMRMHDLSDGFAIPGPCSQPNVIPNISSTDAQLRNKAGTTYVSITADGKIKLVSPSEIDITAPIVKVTGAFSATTITSGTTVLATHEHSGVTIGGGTSGPPV